MTLAEGAQPPLENYWGTAVEDRAPKSFGNDPATLISKVGKSQFASDLDKRAYTAGLFRPFKSRSGHFPDFQSPSVEAQISVRLSACDSQKSNNTGKIADSQPDSISGFGGQMHVRPEFREVLIGKKMQKWCSIARSWPLDRRCPPARARKNYWRLCARYPEIMRRLGLSELSVYE